MNIWATMGIIFGAAALVSGAAFLGIGFGTDASNAEFVKWNVETVCNATGFTTERTGSCRGCSVETCFRFILSISYPLVSGETALNTYPWTNQLYCTQRDAEIAADGQVSRINNGTIVTPRRGKPYPAYQCYYDTRDPNIFSFGTLPDPTSGRPLGIAGAVMAAVGGAMVITAVTVTLVLRRCRCRC